MQLDFALFDNWRGVRTTRLPVSGVDGGEFAAEQANDVVTADCQMPDSSPRFIDAVCGRCGGHSVKAQELLAFLEHDVITQAMFQGDRPGSLFPSGHRHNGRQERGIVFATQPPKFAQRRLRVFAVPVDKEQKIRVTELVGNANSAPLKIRKGKIREVGSRCCARCFVCSGIGRFPGP